MKITFIKSLFKNGHRSLEILCPYKATVVRRLSLDESGTTVTVDALTEEIEVPADTRLGYHAWFFDRGSILFKGKLKLCTEADIAQYPDGSTEPILPSDTLIEEALIKQGG
jgi:hypothetical protein